MRDKEAIGAGLAAASLLLLAAAPAGASACPHGDARRHVSLPNRTAASVTWGAAPRRA